MIFRDNTIHTVMIPDHRDIAEYILKNYRNRIVEVGVGNLPQVALLLKDRMDVVVTDNSQDLIDTGVYQKHAGIRLYIDDIFNPDMKIYKNASLIYSIRPPIDIQEAIARTAKRVGADLLIRPFGNEKADLSMFYKNHAVINYKKARFFIYKA